MIQVPGVSLEPYLERLERLDPFVWSGEVVELVGLLIESRGPSAAIGDFCEILASGGRAIRTQVIGFRNGNVLSMALEEIDGLQAGRPHRGAPRPGAGGRRACAAGPRARRLRPSHGLARRAGGQRTSTTSTSCPRIRSSASTSPSRW